MKRIKVKSNNPPKPKVEEEVYTPMKIEDMSIEELRQYLEDARKHIDILEFDLSISDDEIRGLRAECTRLTKYSESLKSIINKYIKTKKTNCPMKIEDKDFIALVLSSSLNETMIERDLFKEIFKDNTGEIKALKLEVKRLRDLGEDNINIVINK